MFFKPLGRRCKHDSSASPLVSADRSRFRVLPVFGRYCRLVTPLSATLPKSTFVTHLESALPQKWGRATPPNPTKARYTRTRHRTARITRRNTRHAHLRL